MMMMMMMQWVTETFSFDSLEQFECTFQPYIRYLLMVDF